MKKCCRTAHNSVWIYKLYTYSVAMSLYHISEHNVRADSLETRNKWLLLSKYHWNLYHHHHHLIQPPQLTTRPGLARASLECPLQQSKYITCRRAHSMHVPGQAQSTLIFTFEGIEFYNFSYKQFSICQVESASSYQPKKLLISYG